MQRFRPADPGVRIGFSHTVPIVVADSLTTLRGPVTGVVKLPLHIDWTPASTYDLSDRDRVCTMYETVLREAGTESELDEFLNRDLLTAVWPDLNLSRFIREMWEQAHPELAPAASR